MGSGSRKPEDEEGGLWARQCCSAAAAVLAFGMFVAPYVGTDATMFEASAAFLAGEERRTVDLFKKNTPAVVNVTNMGMRYTNIA